MKKTTGDLFEDVNTCLAKALQPQSECLFNGRIFIYSTVNESSDGCFSAGNPFLSKNTGIPLILESACQVSVSTTIQHGDEAFGATQDQVRKVTIVSEPKNGLFGQWAFIRHSGALISGKITKLSNDKPPFLEIWVDTSKPAPFRSSLVGLTDETGNLLPRGQY